MRFLIGFGGFGRSMGTIALPMSGAGIVRQKAMVWDRWLGEERARDDVGGLVLERRAAAPSPPGPRALARAWRRSI